MKLLLVGDLHFRAYKLKDVSEAWAKIVNWAQSNQVDLIAQAGDVFDRPNVFGKEADIGTIYGAFLAPFQKAPLNVVMIPGNHDQGGPRDRDALTPFDKHHWIKVVHTPEVVEINDELSICAVPWWNRASIVATFMDRGMPVRDCNRAANDVLEKLLTKLAKEVANRKAKGQFVLFLGHLEVTGSKHATRTQSDGLFEFAPAALGAVKCDAYALGHIHERQPLVGLPNANDGYLGPLCQTNFGEETYEAGVRLLEIEKGKIVKDTFLNNKSSPRYLTVTSMADVKGGSYRQGIDYLKLRGSIRPESLPSGVEFEKLPDPNTHKRRVAENIDAGTPIAKLIEIWAKEQGCEIPVDTLAQQATHILSKADLPGDSVGSLERIDRILLRKITSHEDSEIDLSSIDGLCGVMGPNGSGKTSAMEGMLLSLYGEAPSRKKIPELVSDQHTGDSLIEMDFVSAGQKFTVRREFRKTAKTFTHTAYVFKTGSKNPEAGPKVEDVDSFCTTLVGDKDLVLAGIFSCQKHREDAGDIIQMDPSDRKEIFAKLLGTDKFLVIGETAKDKGKADNAIIDAYKARVEKIRNDLATQEEPDIAGAEAQAETLSKDLVEKNKTVQGIQVELQQAKNVEKQRSDAATKSLNLTAQRDKIKAEAVKLKEERDTLEKIDQKAIQDSVDSVRKTKAKQDAVSEEITTKNNELIQLANQEGLLGQAISKLQNERNDAYVKELNRHNTERTKLAEDRKSTRKTLEDELQKLTVKQTETESEVTQAEKAAGLIKGIPNVEACAKCPLAKNGIENKENLPKLKRAASRAKDSVTKANETIGEFDTETNKLVKAKDDAAPKTDTFETKIKADIDALKEQLPEIKKKTTKIQGEKTKLEEKLAEYKKATEGLPALETELEKAKGAKNRIEVIDNKINDLRTRFKEIAEAIKEIVVPEIPDVTDINARLTAANEAVKKVQDALTQKNIEIGQLRAKKTEIEKLTTEIDTLEDSIRKLNKNVEVNNALAKAFSRDGIPQLIVDSAIPHFQEIMADLIRGCNGHWSIDVQTQKETKKSKNIKEEILITVDAGLGPRDIGTYSGGEQKLLKTLVRIAFATLQAERSGKGLKVMVLDEATDALDDLRADAFIKMIPRLAQSFNQVFIVSHDAAILSSLPNKLVFSKAGPTAPTVVESFFAKAKG